MKTTDSSPGIEGKEIKNGASTAAERRLRVLRLPFTDESFAERAMDPRAPESFVLAVADFTKANPETNGMLHVSYEPYVGDRDIEAGCRPIYEAWRVMPGQGDLVRLQILNVPDEGAIRMSIYKDDYVLRGKNSLVLTVGYDGSIEMGQLRQTHSRDRQATVEEAKLMLESIVVDPSREYVD